MAENPYKTVFIYRIVGMRRSRQKTRLFTLPVELFGFRIVRLNENPFKT
jgi:hypothetical protein